MVETLVAIAVLGIFFASIASILHMILQNVGESRVRIVALALAQSKMETIRNLPYANVGTVGGIPSGPIDPSETVTINNLPFTITTSIIYIDDPFDNLAPTDSVNTDYKRVRIEITWNGVYPSRIPVSLVTNFVPKGIETISGGGTLFLSVFDSQGQSVPNATVKIDNVNVTPNIHLQTLSDAFGLVVLPGAPACLACYEISITKQNFSTDKTYTTAQVANPLHPLLSVFAGQITQDSFAIDSVSGLSITSYGGQELGYPLIANVRFTLQGSKIIGNDTNDEPVHKYSYTTNTGGGYVSIPGLEWDIYTLDFSDSYHNLAGSNPLNPIAIAPGSNLSMSIVAVPKTNTSLLVAVKNSSGELQASASANLVSTPSADLTKYTSASGSADFGQVFFGGLLPGFYDLKINISGYQEATASLNISGIRQETVTLNPIQ